MKFTDPQHVEKLPGAGSLAGKDSDEKELLTETP